MTEKRNKRKTKADMMAFWAFIIFVVCPLTCAMLYCGDDPDESEQKELVEDKEDRKVFNSPIDHSVLQVKYYLKNTLNDPDSYKPVEWSEVKYLENDNKYMVRHKYRAKNSFGGVITKNDVFFLDSEGKVECQMDYEKASMYSKLK